ncbi:hypothetical protein HU200_003717 [Digitaria exilis]|uniref:Disease resistance N-terminal domain-containing protein n=1 Tax=Digitaria exilis TaxID=1010633 RepID=A0A835KY31_9POAL|nr:hypothetical protein HU200_003717 [Digitaria exilis]
MEAHEERDNNKVVKTWVKQVRDTAYDVEDTLQDFAVRVQRPSWWPCVAKKMKELRANGSSLYLQSSPQASLSVAHDPNSKSRSKSNSSSDREPESSQLSPRNGIGPVSTQHSNLSAMRGLPSRHLKRHGRITREAELNLPLPARTNDLTHSPIGGEKADPKQWTTGLINNCAFRDRSHGYTACTPVPNSGCKLAVANLRHSPQLVTPNRNGTLLLSSDASSPPDNKYHTVVDQHPDAAREKLAGTPPTKQAGAYGTAYPPQWSATVTIAGNRHTPSSQSQSQVTNVPATGTTQGFSQKLAPGSLIVAIVEVVRSSVNS